MPKASELKKGQVVEIDGEPWSVKQVEAKSPSSRGASTLYKIRFFHVKTKQKRDESFKGEDFLRDADCQRVAVQYSYRDGDSFNFMDLEDYSQYALNADELEEQIAYLAEGLEGIYALLLDGQIAGIELPQFVEMDIVETDPAIKGASATGRTKTATTSTGLTLQVPEYLDVGERIKVTSATGKFSARAS
ncbi:elongation factor P-like protein YeiP [Chromatiales bacterium (ex Bugula neritina AB1)]|nr:elongation factor P-like protein YeiP [Chromatiales bacterium (ex Bugula neritina AB1)]